jgi:hypothetical protein
MTCVRGHDDHMPGGEGASTTWVGEHGAKTKCTGAVDALHSLSHLLYVAAQEDAQGNAHVWTVLASS